MRILSFDTSTTVVHLALLDNSTVVDEREVSPDSTDRKEIGSVLMPEIDKAVKTAGWRKADIDLIVVGIGPGSFTGIRVAVITARTLAQFLQIGLIGISTLETYYVAGAAPDPAGIVISTTSKQFFHGTFASTVATSQTPQGCGNLAEVTKAMATLPLVLADAQFIEATTPTKSTHQLPLIKNVATVQAQLASDRLSLMGLLGDSDRLGDRTKLRETFLWQNVLPLYLRSPSVTLKKTHAT